MRLLLTFLRLPPNDRRLLLWALLWVPAVRAALWLLPFRVVRGLVDRKVQHPRIRRARPAPSAERIAWAVTAVSSRVPHATCLTQALATQILLASQGERSRLHIGVARNPSGSFEAHAWVEHGGRIIIGEREMAAFTALPQWGNGPG